MAQMVIYYIEVITRIVAIQKYCCRTNRRVSCKKLKEESADVCRVSKEKAQCEGL
ncbi:MAG: hypothetical protein RQM92_04305 [Candidatus Syntrophopropionicum ammoniitolerans]